ncbi:HupE/UreJ family protein [Flavobacterium sp. LS1P28]|uniref:HupE/UreJ family protein n=1 Tax=Flavobacterium bomense TaxID=2497483 RepID=A0A432CMH7_9FLAO|nr:MULTISPECIES: HupE/UreJ family protein [Flavobacterium]RTY94763.1 HupE/UreJ family protein [Flavobacterium sp. GSN2]RTY67668.1 HupE/UreJ family protein [Flavobacterium sp. LB2P53]RTY73451.1 HupE/UreJ family protein [Flavobacterium sp. LS1R10]RTY81743.1 HupE/UreJ family protein [Flavobacterium sp. LS1P28]RTY91477.1 HupE/UreJ family protein [Flavobacterium sp. RSP46]
MNSKKIIFLVILFFVGITGVFAHGVDENTQTFLSGNDGVAFGPFLYIGAKHMLTGYDHLLFLVGVIFFLYRPKEVLLYVSFFTIGHSATLLFGVMSTISINSYLIDAIIALSIVYKGFDNLGGFKKFFGRQPNTKAAVLIFGLFHGFGLASKLQDFKFEKEGLFTNLLGFNIGVEIGQFIALTFVLILITLWRRHSSFMKFSTITNTLLMAAGFVLIGYQLTGYFTS